MDPYPEEDDVNFRAVIAGATNRGKKSKDGAGEEEEEGGFFTRQRRKMVRGLRSTIVAARLRQSFPEFRPNEFSLVALSAFRRTHWAYQQDNWRDLKSLVTEPHFSVLSTGLDARYPLVIARGYPLELGEHDHDQRNQGHLGDDESSSSEEYESPPVASDAAATAGVEVSEGCDQPEVLQMRLAQVDKRDDSLSFGQVTVRVVECFKRAPEGRYELPQPGGMMAGKGKKRKGREGRRRGRSKMGKKNQGGPEWIAAREGKRVDKDEEGDAVGTTERGRERKMDGGRAGGKEKEEGNSVWAEAKTEEGKVYYWHKETRETCWVRPDDITGDRASGEERNGGIRPAPRHVDDDDDDDDDDNEEEKREEEEPPTYISVEEEYESRIIDVPGREKGQSEGDHDIYKATFHCVLERSLFHRDSSWRICMMKCIGIDPL